MSPDVALFLYGTMAVPFTFWIGAYSFLPGGEHAFRTMSILSLIAICGAMAAALGALDLGFAIATVAPIYQFGLIFAARRLFRRRFGRDPVDVALNFERGLLADRIYAFVCTLGGIFPVAAVLYPFTPAATLSAA